MKIEFWYIGKTNEKYLKDGMALYAKRLKHYCNFREICIKDVKGISRVEELKLKEAQEVLSKLGKDDYLVLLDEKGDRYTSVGFSKYIENLQLNATKRVVFLIAGAYGAHVQLIERAQKKLSLSDMTFSHQMIRLFFMEQLYRAFSILRNEKYHNQ